MLSLTSIWLNTLKGTGINTYMVVVKSHSSKERGNRGFERSSPLQTSVISGFGGNKIRGRGYEYHEPYQFC